MKTLLARLHQMATLFPVFALAIILCAPPRATSAAETIGANFVTDKGTVGCATDSHGVQCRGIPYAAPPQGALRFRPPAEVQPWSGVRDATAFAPACIQAKTDYVKEQVGSEDCLYLNVYVPKASSTAPLPVMVWFHGGGFMNGSGNAFDGRYLAQTARAIVVTVNYRLGPFGWLALDSLAAEARDGSTGNYGLLDNIAALKWVQRNIVAFGGDSQRVTIFGQSAGGEQVFAMLASPYAAGLFQRAISMSAPAGLSLPDVAKAQARRKRFLADLGCIDPVAQPACLRAASAQRMLDAAHEDWDMFQSNGLQWTPTIDGAVLKSQWLDRFREGDFNRVPVMVGHTRDEARLFAAIYENNHGGQMTETQVEDATRRSYGLVSKVMLYKYREAGTPAGMMSHIVVDALFATGESWDRDALARYVPVYGYQSCDERAPESHVHAIYSAIGCGHDSDLSYLFQWDDFAGQQPDFTAGQRDLAVQMSRYWGNFAASGNPNGTGLPVWPVDTAGAGQVELLEPAGMGGIRAISEETYREQHHIGFWTPLLWLANTLGLQK
jgi:para-nitrobenzyl esterase